MKLKETIFDLNARFPSLAGKRTHVVRRDGAFQKLSEQGRGRLVPAKRRATEKTRGRGRPRPTLERTSCGATRIETFLTQSETSGNARGLKSPMELLAFASRERKDLSAARCTGFFPFTPALSLGENRSPSLARSRRLVLPQRQPTARPPHELLGAPASLPAKSWALKLAGRDAGAPRLTPIASGF